MSKFLEIFAGKKTKNPPLWFMRQAGRYLPEYRDIRKQCPTFLDLCYTPKLVAQVTLQPLKRFDLDAAILFSDILIIPHGLGQLVFFKERKGPQLSFLPLSSFEKELSFKNFLKKMSPIYEAIDLIRSQLPPSKALLGFSGAPWTLALYMLEGEGNRDFAKAKMEAFRHETAFTSFLDFLSQAISLHLIEQIRAGASALQIFDSWAGHCPASHFQKWILEPTQKIVSTIKEVFPHIPIIGFPKGVGVSMLEYATRCGFSALSLDSNMSLRWAVKNLPSHLILQGNLDPLILCVGGDSLRMTVHSIHEQVKERPYIFNLGHGIVPQTPIKNVEECISWVRSLR